MKKLFLTIALCLIAIPVCAGVTATTVPQNDPVGLPYPKIMKYDGAPTQTVILCVSHGNCTTLVSNDPLLVGTQLTGINLMNYVDYVGTITLENTAAP